MTLLSVNVNKLATLRNARGHNNPDVLKTTLEIIQYGAHGITVHPRPDERHIRITDVYAIAEAIHQELNIEGYPSEDFIALVKNIKPSQCTLVPDPPHVLTSNAGWCIEKNITLLKEVVASLQHAGIRTSLFIDPHNFSTQDMLLLPQTNTDRVELYTEAYANAYHTKDRLSVLNVYQAIAAEIDQLGIGINAGHDLDLDNLSTFVHTIPNVQEVSIGHALICDALVFGMQETIRRYLACLSSMA